MVVFVEFVVYWYLIVIVDFVVGCVFVFVFVVLIYFVVEFVVFVFVFVYVVGWGFDNLVD